MRISIRSRRAPAATSRGDAPLSSSALGKYVATSAKPFLLAVGKFVPNAPNPAMNPAVNASSGSGETTLPATGPPAVPVGLSVPAAGGGGGGGGGGGAPATSP